MCGISGIINIHNPKESSDSLIDMTQSLIHRGPDNERYTLFSDSYTPFFGDDTINKNSQHINDSLNYKFKVGFGFRQLKIIDFTQDFSLTKKQSVELIEESLLKAVNYRLVSDVEVGTFMSGGIDSTMISVMASKSNPNIKALTLGFKEYRDFDEVQQAKDTAKLHNFNHIIHYASTSEAIKNITQTTIFYEEPYHNLSANFALVSMASKNNLKVVLSGLGGDELFGGYDVYNKLLLYERVKKSYISNHQMRAVDQSTMAFSVEGRFPLLDHQFIETVFRIPTKYKLHNGVQKYILKEIAKKYISKSCLQMSKKGLSLPLKHWISTDLKDFVFDTIQQLKKRYIFNRKAVEIIETSNDENKIWQLVSTELWFQFFFDK